MPGTHGNAGAVLPIVAHFLCTQKRTDMRRPGNLWSPASPAIVSIGRGITETIDNHAAFLHNTLQDDVFRAHQGAPVRNTDAIVAAYPHAQGLLSQHPDGTVRTETDVQAMLHRR